MNAALQIAIALGSVAVLIGVMALVRHQATARGWTPEIQRKLVHVSTGLYAITLPWLFTDRWPVLLLLAVTVVVMLVLRLRPMAEGGLGAALHSVERRSYGDLLLALAVGVVFLLADGSAILYVLPLAILTLSDAAAALTGSTYGRQFFKVEEGHKSVEGSVAFFMVSFSLSMICLLLLSDTPRANVVTLAAIVAAFATLVEADSWRGFDNFFIPAGLVVFLQGHLETPPLQLFAIMASFLIIIWAALIYGPRLGVPRHTARVYVTAGFLILTVVAPIHAVLPILVFVAHHLSQQANPSDAAHPELDCVAAIALMSFFWLVLGRVSGAVSLPLFNLTALSMAVSFATLGFPGRGPSLAAGLGAALGGGALYLAYLAPGADPTAIAVPALAAVLALAVAIAVPLSQAPRFATGRALRVGLLAMLVPLGIWATRYPAMEL